MRTAFFAFVALVFISCKNHTQSEVAELELDNVQYIINSAGVAYDVINDHQLDSSAGLNYVVAISVINNGSNPISYNKSNFRLFDDEGKEMSYNEKKGGAMAAVNEAFSNFNIKPGVKQETMFVFAASKHGYYKLRITSPSTNNHKEVSLPAS